MNKTIEIESRGKYTACGENTDKRTSALIPGFIAAGFALDIAIVLYVIISNVL